MLNKNSILSSDKDNRQKTKDILIKFCPPVLYIILLWLLHYFFNYYNDSVVLDLVTLTVLCATGIAFLALLIVFISFARKKALKYDPVIMAIVFGAISYWICESVNSGIIIKEHHIFTLTGIFLHILPFMLGAVFFKKPKIWFGICFTLLSTFCILQYYLLIWRGTPIRLSDVYNISSAANIQNRYSLKITTEFLFVLLSFTTTIVYLVFMDFRQSKAAKRTITFLATVICTLVITFASKSNYSYLYSMGLWMPEKMATTVGSLATVYYDFFSNHMYKANNYSDEQAISILNQYETEEKDVGTPVILTVLNESWADHTILSDFSVNRDYIPTWRALKENTIKGYVTVSPYGSYSCNSKYEYLTGNSMMFLPDGTGVFTSYINGHSDSLVDTFKEYGFDTVGITPVNDGVWKEGYAYGCFGFDRTYFLNGENAFTMTEGTDRELYEKIFNIIDNRDKSKGLFVFASTMQNHSPFDKYISHDIKLEDPYNEEAEIYMNSLYVSDKATLDLINHFKDYDEKVIIVMFGDHFPSIAKFDNALLDNRSELSEIEKIELTHKTPFFIWCNQELDEKEIDEISLNYLSNEVMKAADIPLSPYQQELEHIRSELPIIAGWGYKDKKGILHSKADTQNEYQDIINEYSSLCYYRLIRQYS